MVEWAWFINSHGDNGIYQQLMNGDKDSFLLAFVLAGKTSEYYQVWHTLPCIAPSAVPAPSLCKLSC